MKTFLCALLLLGLAVAAGAAEILLISPDGKNIGPIRTANGEKIKIGEKTYTVQVVEQTAQQRALETKARSLIFPEIDTREASLTDLLSFLSKESKRLDPEKTGINIVSTVSTECPQHRDLTMTISLRNIPLLQALEYIAQLNDLKLYVDNHAIVLYRP